jgi:glycopeptide antibiotics resistance protein
MKYAFRIVFGLYIVCLVWLVLFKTSLDFSSVLTVNIRNLNLIPFTGRLSETVENFVLFIPFGMFLSVAFKKVSFWQKLAIIFVFSLAIETIQYVLAIGISDITDIMTNTLGGLVGLAAYTVGKYYIDEKKISNVITVIVAVLILFFLLLRFFVFRVRY